MSGGVGQPTTATTTVPAEGPRERFTVLTWHLGTVRAGGKISERYTVQVTDATGARASWLVTATGSTTLDASRQPTVLTVEHLVGWTRPLADQPRIAGASSTSTPTTTVPDPFGPSGSGTTTTTTTGAGGASGAATTTTSTTTAGSGSNKNASNPGSSTTPASSTPSSTTSATSLPYTGVNADLELEVAAVALLLGAGVLVTTRRRPATSVAHAAAAPTGPPRQPGSPDDLRAPGPSDPARGALGAALRHSASRLSWPLRRFGSDGGALDGVLARDSLAEGSDLDWLASLADDADETGPEPHEPTTTRYAHDGTPATTPADADLPVRPSSEDPTAPERAPADTDPTGPVATTAESCGVAVVSPLVDVLVPLGGWYDDEWCFDRPLGELLDPVFGADTGQSARAGDR